MEPVWILLPVAFILVHAASAAKVFSCDDGCKGNEACPTNAYCVAVSPNAECGLCLCKAGYRTEGEECKQNNPSGGGGGGGAGGGGDAGEAKGTQPKETNNQEKPKSQKSPQTGSGGKNNGGVSGEAPEESVVVTEVPEVITTEEEPAPKPSGSDAKPPAKNGNATKAGPAAQASSGGAINCADYNCEDGPPDDGDTNDNPFTVRARVFTESPSSSNCKNKLVVPALPCNLAGAGTCYGESCLKDNGNEYCICGYNRMDRQCAVKKQGKCDSATGQPPPKAYQAQNKRYRHKTNPENGSIVARHIAGSFNDCVKLCQWAQGSCRSVNYGTSGGQKLCELLSVVVTKGSVLESWLVDSPGWQHAQCASQ